MSICNFINTQNGRYPFHIEDVVAVLPGATYDVTDEELKPFNLARVELVDKDLEPDIEYKNAVEDTPVQKDGVYYQTWKYNYKTMDECKQIALNKLALTRYGLEVGGIQTNGIFFDTSRETQTKIANLANSNIEHVTWKIPGASFVTLSKEQLQSINDNMVDYVQKLYTEECRIATSISVAENYPDVINAKAAWPSNDYTVNQ